MPGHHWFKKWVGVRSAPSHYLEQYCSSETIGLRPNDILLLNKTKQTFYQVQFILKQTRIQILHRVCAIIWTNDGYVCPEGSKIQARYFWQTCIRSVWALVMESRLCDEIVAFKRTIKTHPFVKFVNKSTLAIWLEASLYSVLECCPHNLWS